MVNVFNEDRVPAIRARKNQGPILGSWIARILGEVMDRMGATRPADYPPGPCAKMMGYLSAERSLVEIQTRVIALPHGWAGPEDNDMENKEEVGRIGKINMFELCSATRPTLLSQGVLASEYDDWVEEFKIDVQTLRCKTYVNLHIWSATVRPQTWCVPV